jgi:hypothetical protein
VVSDDLPKLIVSQWARGNQRRQGRLQHHVVKDDDMIDTLAAAYPRLVTLILLSAMQRKLWL